MMIAIRFVSLHSLFDSILGDIQHERGGGDRKEIKYFKRRIAAVNSISLEMAIWKIDQFHPLALLSACRAENHPELEMVGKTGVFQHLYF